MSWLDDLDPTGGRLEGLIVLDGFVGPLRGSFTHTQRLTIPHGPQGRAFGSSLVAQGSPETKKTARSRIL